MFFGISQRYTIDIYEFYFEEYMLGYLNFKINFMGVADSLLHSLFTKY